MAALGASLRDIGAFLWSEAALVLGAALGSSPPGSGWLLAEMLVAMLQHVFDPPPDHLAVPWAFLGGLVGAALGAAAWSPPGSRSARSGACRSVRSCARSDRGPPRS